MSELKHKEATHMAMAFMQAVSEKFSEYNANDEADEILRNAQANFMMLSRGETIPATEYSQPQSPTGRGAKSLDKMISEMVK